MTKIDLPEGARAKKVIKGGEKAIEIIMAVLGQKSFDGYIKVILQENDEKITSYMIIKDSTPQMGLREIIGKAKKDPTKLVRRQYIGEHVIEEVRIDSHNINARIELHSGIDVDTILDRYASENRHKLPPPPDDHIIGLFWGEEEEDGPEELTLLKEKLSQWKKEGYRVTRLEKALNGDLKGAKAAFKAYEEDISKLEGIATVVNELAVAGFGTQVKPLHGKLKDPDQISYLRSRIKVIQNTKPGEKTAGETCIVCGFPIEEGEDCGRCGSTAEERALRAVEEISGGLGEEKRYLSIEEIVLNSGHCYLVEENKLKNTLRLFEKQLNEEFSGFCITRTNPKHLKSLKEREDTTIMWLTDKESTTELTIQPVLERIMYEINDFMRTGDKGCIILDGIEYLVSNNGFDGVLRFIRRLVDEVSESKSILLITVSPYTLIERELKILEHEMEKIQISDF